jgi:hypothetical protein
MPESASAKTATPPVSRRAARITLFGPSNAGKGLLAKALLEHGEIPGKPAPWRFTEVNADRAALRKNLSDPALLKADALLLVLDAAGYTGQLEENLAAFARFLSLLEQVRGNRAAVGGWPVFLVLTRCDLLAPAGESQAVWRQRIDQVKRRAEEIFQHFKAGQTAGPVPFGRIDLRIQATAAKPAVLAEASSKPNELFGIEELFQQVSVAVRAYGQRRARSTRRLALTTMVTLLLFAGVLALAGLLVTQRRLEDPAVRELLDKVESYRAREPLTTSNRLREPLQPHLSELADLEHDPHFAQLPTDKREYVRQRRQELEDYRAYQDSLQQLPSIASLSSERELETLEGKLKQLTFPTGPESDWSQTEAALLRSRLLKEASALRAGIAEMQQWYGNLQERGQTLAALATPAEASEWRTRLGLLLQQAARLPHQDRDLLPGTRLTYKSVYRFSEVVQARSAWEELRGRLEHLAHISQALGLGVPDAAQSPLALPAGFTAEQAGPLLAELEKLYPHYQKEFTLSNLPEAAVAPIRQAARQRYDVALAAGREVVLRRWREANPDAQDTPENWRRLLPWLADPPELKAWRVLALLLAHLVDPAAADPVADFQAFLSRDQFDIALKRLYLEVPEGSNLEPSGKLAVEHASSGTATATAPFDLLTQVDRDGRRQITRYTLRPPGEVRFTFRPGDTISAELPVNAAGSADHVLSWSRSRSQSYQFERLLRAPWLRSKGQAGNQGEAVEGVRLVISPDEGLPRVPDLLPDLSPAR